MSAKPAYEYNAQRWSDIQEHLPRLFAAASQHCVEIGVRTGMSTSALLAGVERRGGHLWSFDVNDCPVFKGHPQWTFTRMDTVKDAKFALEYIPVFVNVLFVDGDHTYEGVRADFLMYRDYVRPSGYIAFHDINDSEFHRANMVGVARLWDELKGHKIEFNLNQTWAGIGVIQHETLTMPSP